jgi:transposase
VVLSPAEQAVVKRIRRATLFVWLREHRHELLDEAFQVELAAAYQDSPRGHPPVPPAQLALATILQAYTGASDDEVLEATVMDRRWQLVLDCWDATQAPFGKATLVGFRARLIAGELDRRLVQRTVALAKQTGGFGAGPLRAALDSSPWWGAGRVEDTINLMGHALCKALGVVARQQGRGLAAVAELAAEAGAPVLGGSSLKAALDCDWDDPAARQHALVVVVDAVEAVEAFLARFQLAGDAALAGAAVALAAARQVCVQDVARGPDQTVSIRQGVARDRRISIQDAQMRHGRKTKRVRWTATSGTCCATWTPAWSVRSGSPRPTSPRPASPTRSPPTWPSSMPGWPSCISTGPTYPARWSATATRSWRSAARRSRCATDPGLPRPPLGWTSTAAS